MNRFDEINRQLKVMRNAGLPDTPSYKRLSDMALECAPEWLATEIMSSAVREGMIPPPTRRSASTLMTA